MNFKLCEQHINFVLMIIWILNLGFGSSTFSEIPVTQHVHIGEEAIFRCHHYTADVIRWRVNGSLISNSMIPDGITPGSVRDGDIHVQTLMITGRLDYNGTKVVCVARFDLEREDENTSAAFLYVNGSAATHVTEPTTTHVSISEFTVQPSTTIAAIGTVATFCCQHHDAEFITWYFNGTDIRDQYPTNVSTTTMSDHELEGAIIHMFNVPAVPQYNMTYVQCAGFFQGSSPELFKIMTPPAQLLIQGKLSEVTHLRRHPANASVTWRSPYSLNISDAEPDISYCINVTNITCGGTETVINNCNVKRPYYNNSSILNQADLFEIVVTPSSNIKGAVPGNETKITEKYIYFNASTISAVVNNMSSDIVDINVQIRMGQLFSEIIPGSFIVHLESITAEDFRNFTSHSVVLTESLLILKISNVPSRVLWNCTIFGTRCGGKMVSDITTLSTFDIQDVVIGNSPQQSIVVDCKLIEGSRAAGLLIIAYSLIDPSEVHYEVSQSDNQGRIRAVLSCLPGNLYVVNLYVITEDGLPLQQPASLPITANTTGIPDYTDCNVTEPIDYRIYPKDDKLCVECNSTCVVIVHQNVSLLNSSNDFVNIQYVNDSTSARDDICFNLDDYQIGVIPFMPRPVNPTESNSTPSNEVGPVVGQGILIVVVCSCLIGVAIILGVPLAAICIIRRRYYCDRSNFIHRKQLEQKCGLKAGSLNQYGAIDSEDDSRDGGEHEPPCPDQVSTKSGADYDIKGANCKPTSIPEAGETDENQPNRSESLSYGTGMPAKPDAYQVETLSKGSSESLHEVQSDKEIDRDSKMDTKRNLRQTTKLKYNPSLKKKPSLFNSAYGRHGSADNLLKNLSHVVQDQNDSGIDTGNCSRSDSEVELSVSNIRRTAVSNSASNLLQSQLRAPSDKPVFDKVSAD